MEARNRTLWAIVLLALLSASGCGITRRIAVSSMVPILETTIEVLYRDQDVDTAREGMPGNLILLRGLCESDRGNRSLWAMTVQLYFYYALGFVEDEDPERAAILYEQGFSLGREALSRRGWFDPDSDLDTFRDRLRKAGRDDLPLLFWSLANWTKWINLNLNDPSALAQLPFAEAALDRVLEIDPAYFLGMPHAMRGTLEASKPVLMGGDPERAREEFEAAFTVSNRKLLMFHLFYAQYYCRQQLDRQGFEETLREVLESDPNLEPDYRLLNEVARRKAARLMEQADELF